MLRDAHAVALHQMYYNFVRIHQTLKVTPAMAAGVTDKLWEVSDIVTMIEAWKAEHAKTGTVYEVAKNDIGGGYHVRRIPRFDEEPKTVFGFADTAAAKAWVEADKASHKPGQKGKAAT